MRDALTLAVAAGFAAMALGAMLRPRDVLAQFGLGVDTADGRNEVRAVYGGFGLAVAALLTIAALGDPSTSEGILVAVAFALVGMARGPAAERRAGAAAKDVSGLGLLRGRGRWCRGAARSGVELSLR